MGRLDTLIPRSVQRKTETLEYTWACEALITNPQVQITCTTVEPCYWHSRPSLMQP